MKKKIIALALCLLMILPLAFIGCDEEEPPAPPPPPPTGNLLDSIEYIDTKTGASTIKSFDFEDGTFFTTFGDSFIASGKQIYDTEDPTKLISIEYKLANIYNDTVITVATNEAITSEDAGYATAITGLEIDTYDENEDFVVVFIAYGDATKGDIRLYNKYGVMLLEEKGVSLADCSSKIDFDEDFNSDTHSFYGPIYLSFLKKVYMVNEDDLTLEEVIDFNKANFELDAVAYIKEIDKFISCDYDGDGVKVIIFSDKLVLESANQFIFNESAMETFCTFVSPTVAIFTEIILLPDDAEECDAYVYSYKADIKITKFDFATGNATDLEVGDVVLCDTDYEYNRLYSEVIEKAYGIKYKELLITSEYYTIENKMLVTHNDLVAIDENLNVIKYLEYPVPSDESSMALQLPNGELVMYTTYGVYHVNADGTLGALISLDDIEFNNLWKILDEKEIYDNTNTLIYTIPETREIEAILNNSLILSERVEVEGNLIGYKYILWKGVGNEAQIGSDPVDMSDPSKFPTEGTYSMLNEDLLSYGYYAVMSASWADIAAGKLVYSITIYDDLGTQLAKYDNVTDYDIDYGDINDFLKIEITTYDAEQNPTVSYKLVVIQNQEKFYFYDLR